MVLIDAESTMASSSRRPHWKFHPARSTPRAVQNLGGLIEFGLNFRMGRTDTTPGSRSFPQPGPRLR